MLSINGQKVVMGMGNEDYEVIDKLESIAKSLESLAESQKRIADTLEWMAKEKGFVDWSGKNLEWEKNVLGMENGRKLNIDG